MSLGIDIGTCWSSAAVVIGGEPRPIQDPHRLAYTVPSAACWDPVAGGLLVGEAAEFAGREDPALVVREFKRDVGKGTTYHLGGHAFGTADLIAGVVRQFAAEAAAVTAEGKRPTAAVLTVPAHWAGHSRQCLADAAKAAGVEPYLLAEPVAVALYYEHLARREIPDGEPVLVYHLGGGAFTAALLVKRAGRFAEPIPSRGSDEIGGAAFENVIYQDLKAAAPAEFRGRLDARDDAGTLLRLTVLAECRRLKHHLSRASSGSVRTDPDDAAWSYTLSAARFEAMIRPRLDASVKLCRELLADAGDAAGKPVRVMLVGGSTRIPLVGRVLEEAFGKPLDRVADPELVVCKGAALHAARVCPDPILADPELAAAVRAVEAERKKQEEAAKKKPFIFLLAGRTGVGKSSTINSLLGKKVAPVGDHAPTTAEVKAYPVEMGPVRFSVVDTPGLCDGLLAPADEMHYLDLMARDAPEIHSLWFVTELDDPRVGADESRAVELITRRFGAKVWRHAVIVFTGADRVYPPEQFATDVFEREKEIRALIGRHAGSDVASEIPGVAVSNLSTATPDGRAWKGLLYATVFRRVASGGLLTLTLGTEARIRVVGGPVGGRVGRRASRFRILDTLSADDDFDDDGGAGRDRVMNAPIEIDQPTAAEFRGRVRESIVDSCARTGGSIGESVGRFFGAPSGGRSVGESVGRAIGKVLSWFGW